MTQPPHPPGEGSTPAYGQYDTTASFPAALPSSETGPGSQWATPPAPSWAPPWQPPAPPPPSGPVPAATATRTTTSRNRLLLALVAVAGVLVGALGAGALVTALFISSAGDIGREIGAEIAPTLEDGLADGLSRGMTESMEEALAFADDEMAGALGATPGPVEQFPPAEPVDLGSDPALDAYAVGCFDGDLPSCDDLYYEAPPLSAYERYANTCGGRVKEYTVMTCTELE